MKKKFLSIILALVVALSMIPLSASIAFAEGENPIQDEMFSLNFGEDMYGEAYTCAYYSGGYAITPTVDCNDKDVTFEVAYSNNTQVGTATATITGTGDYTGQVIKSFTIAKRPVNNYDTVFISLSKDKYAYDGKVHKPKVTVCFPITEDKIVKLKKDRDYTVTYSTKKSIGVAAVTIKGIGNYSGKTKAEFFITPKNAKIKSVKVGKKSVTVKMAKTAKQLKATYYAISYVSTDFKHYSKKEIIKKGSSFTIKNLKKGKKYYIYVSPVYKKETKSNYVEIWGKECEYILEKKVK